jgi:O-antigen/teichoic acid export membrane protein
VKSMGRPNLGILLDTALYPFLLIALAAWVHLQNQQIDDQALRVAYGAALWLAALIGVLVGRKGPGAVRTAWLAPRRVPRALYAEIGSVTLGAASNLIASNAAVAMAPFFLTDTDVGSLGVALRVAGFATTLLVSLNAYYGPAFVRAESPGELSSLLRQSQALSTALYLPVPLLCLILPEGWLAAVDPALGSVKTFVAILSVGYLVNAVTGLCSTILIMRGHSREFALVNAVGAGLTVAAVASGGALAGAVGIAIGLSTAMALSNLWTYHVAQKHLT